MKIIILVISLLVSPLAMADHGVTAVPVQKQQKDIKLLSNKCWNTKLSSNKEAICDECNIKVDKSFDVKCEEEIIAYEEAADYLFTKDISAEEFEKRYGPWRNALNTRDNCKITLINKCFDESLANN